MRQQRHYYYSSCSPTLACAIQLLLTVDQTKHGRDGLVERRVRDIRCSAVGSKAGRPWFDPFTDAPAHTKASTLRPKEALPQVAV